MLSVLASTACVPLAGRLVRHRGAITCAVTAGLLAVYPADVLSARTLLLEPWMNLAVPARGRPRRSATAGWRARAGWPGRGWRSVSAWRSSSGRRSRRPCCSRSCLIAPAAGGHVARQAPGGALTGGAAGGFAVLAGPFALADPSAFVHQTLLYQVSRVGRPARSRCGWPT